MNKDPSTILKDGVNALGLTLTKNDQIRLITFLKLLQKWNQTFNLTAITQLDKMISHHLLDSLAIAPYIAGRRVLDVGTGAGLPGIPLAIAMPEKQFVLLDKSAKKTRFLLQAKAELQITNIEIINDRVENFHTPLCFDAIIFRAVGAVNDLLMKTRHLCCENGKFLFLKGTHPNDELEDRWVYQTIPIEVPTLNAKRHLVIIEKPTSKE